MPAPPRPDLRVDWATHAAAVYAVKHWHYTRSMPASKSVKLGVWEDGRFIGVVIFARGAAKHLGSPYGLTALQCCELVRVALNSHASSVSRILAIAVQLFRKKFPGCRLIVSFADPHVGHVGGIYQASNWTFTGQTPPAYEYRLPNGTRINKRAYSGGNYGSPRLALPAGATRHPIPGKYRYLLPLDPAMRAQVALLAKPYPKRAKHAMAGPPAQRQGSTDPHAPDDPDSGARHGETRHEGDAAGAAQAARQPAPHAAPGRRPRRDRPAVVAA